MYILLYRFTRIETSNIVVAELKFRALHFLRNTGDAYELQTRLVTTFFGIHEAQSKEVNKYHPHNKYDVCHCNRLSALFRAKYNYISSLVNPGLIIFPCFKKHFVMCTRRTIVLFIYHLLGFKGRI